MVCFTIIPCKFMSLSLYISCKAHSLGKTRPKGSRVRKKFRQRIADAFELTRVSSFADRCLHGFPLFCKSPAASISSRLPLASWLSFSVFCRTRSLPAARISFGVSLARTFDPSAAGEHRRARKLRQEAASSIAASRVLRSARQTRRARSSSLRFERSARN